MSERLQTSLRATDRACYVKLAGIIDEENALGALQVPAAPSPLYIDCGEVERINSCGVRDWIRWVDALTNAGHRIILIDCAPPIVAQLNLVANFVGSSPATNHVRSVQLPYFCGTCDEEQVVTVEVREIAARAGLDPAPACRCRTCDATMDFDDIPESYFSFLTTRRIAVDTSDAAALAAFVTAPTGLLRPRLAVERKPEASTTSPPPRAGAMPSLMALSSLPSISTTRASAPVDQPAPALTLTPSPRPSRPHAPPAPRPRSPWVAWSAVLLLIAAALGWWLTSCASV